ncbi:MAG: acetyltransferase family protein [Massilia sp.]|jgi:ribosomal protein S18 acetylase RimI-like enzyme|nr:acetyltransferase family protein [Massilia sp.]
MIRKAVAGDRAQVLALYKLVAAIPDGIARTPGEVTEDYVDGFMQKAASHGLELVWEEKEEGEGRGARIVGEIHAVCPGIASLSHLLTDLTIAVAPDAQGRGVGRALFQTLLDEVTFNLPRIHRVELFARVSNEKARNLYKSLGFVEEGRLRARVNNAQGIAEDDTLMGWLRPAAFQHPAIPPTTNPKDLA